MLFDTLRLKEECVNLGIGGLPLHFCCLAEERSDLRTRIFSPIRSKPFSEVRGFADIEDVGGFFEEVDTRFFRNSACFGLKNHRPHGTIFSYEKESGRVARHKNPGCAGTQFEKYRCGYS